jgi:hypothetical protein
MRQTWAEVLNCLTECLPHWLRGNDLAAAAHNTPAPLECLQCMQTFVCYKHSAELAPEALFLLLLLHSLLCIIIIIIIMLPNQAIASTPSAPRPSGAEGRGSTTPLCLQLLRTSQACTRYSAILLEITRHLPLLPQISSDTKRNNLVEASGNDNTLRSLLCSERRRFQMIAPPLPTWTHHRRSDSLRSGAALAVNSSS